MNCPICNEYIFSKWGEVEHYSILKCNGCGLGITSPFPDEEDSAKMNQEIYQVKYRIQIYLSKQSYFVKRYMQYIKNIKKYKEKGRLLDIGCNIGLFLKVAQQEGFEVSGVEINKECADYGIKHFNLDIYTDYIEDIAFSDEKFDVITLFDVLEHVPDLHNFISEIARLLKDDGLLVLQSPNIDSLMATLTKSKWDWLTPPDHLYHFTPEVLTKFLISNGFNIKEIKTWEPAEDFFSNVLSAYLKKGILSKAFIKVMNNKISLIPIVLLQKIWWRRQMGGLIEVYATMSDGGDMTCKKCL